MFQKESFRESIKDNHEYFNREATRISALSSGKTDQYEYLTGE